jgi:lysophospholipase L1-like esterase
VVALGDSTTAGTPGFLSPLEAPPAGRGDVTSQYAWWLRQAHPEWEVLNRGVNGERSDQIATRFDRDVLGVAPTVAIIIGGVNDVYQGLPATHAIDHLRRMYRRAIDAGIRVVAGSILPFNTATEDHNVRMRAINDWIRTEATRQLPISFADTRRAVATPDDGDRLNESPDGLHPSAAGYRLMADELLRRLEQLDFG